MNGDTPSAVGLEVPDFSVPATGHQLFRLSERRGHPLVIYFYPKDNTPGCTTEAGQFRDLYPEFAKRGCEIVGVSRDSLASHENFKAALGLPFDLLSDGDETVCRLFGVMKVKTMYGRQSEGVERSTFLIDPTGILRREWRGVKVNGGDGHAAEVLKAIAEMQAGA